MGLIKLFLKKIDSNAKKKYFLPLILAPIIFSILASLLIKNMYLNFLDNSQLKNSNIENILGDNIR